MEKSAGIFRNTLYYTTPLPISNYMNIRLFEFEDLSWFPDVIRGYMLDYLSFFLRKTHFYDPVTPLIVECLEHTNEQQLIDLCSGGGGPIPEIQKKLAQHIGVLIPIILTDKFPNKIAYESLRKKSAGSIGFIASSIDATCVPKSLKGVRTSFSALHHFNERTVKSLLVDAVANHVPIALFDGGDKNLLLLLGGILLHPIVFFFCTPFFKPFKLSRIFFTYIIPVIPLCTIWDGMVSIVRLYNLSQLSQLTAETDNSIYTWKTGVVRNKLRFGISYLYGYPKAPKTSKTNV